MPETGDFIHIGAADGYHTNESLASALVSRCIAFEANLKLRQIMNENLRLNGVRDSLTVEGVANEKV